MRPPEHAPDRGFVTAETAVVVPSLVLLLAMLLWGVLAAVALVQCVDGARAGARAAARGEQRDAVRRAAESAAPPGASVTLSREGDLVRVRVRARSFGPGLLTLPVRADAVALAEDTVGRPSAAAQDRRSPPRHSSGPAMGSRASGVAR